MNNDCLKKLRPVPLSEARVGDHFSGVLDLGTKGEIFVSGRLNSAAHDNGKLWAHASLPYTTSDRWTNITISREIEPLPTKPGIYMIVNSSTGKRAEGLARYLLAHDGKWSHLYSDGTVKPLATDESARIWQERGDLKLELAL